MDVWDTIIEIKNRVASNSENFSMISVTSANKHLNIAFDKTLPQASFNIILENPQNHSYDSCIIAHPFHVEIGKLSNLTNSEVSFLEMYLPYALLPYYARKLNKCFAISHFAQTLDGRIASFSGESKWIGNEENLIHAHRMRAICDSILVGSNTLVNDNPKLNVRHVKGTDPIKIIIGGAKLQEEKYHALSKSSIMFCENGYDDYFETERVHLKKDPCFSTRNILKSLYDKGIHTVYIEGGSYTTSKFLTQNTIDQVQVHISPQILGSGLNSFAFEELRNMNHSIKFKDSKFIQVGKDMMFIGHPIY